MLFLIGIDDTDNLESRGTGYRARSLGTALAENQLAQLLAITRHQLLVHPAIRYTSHNSSACLLVESSTARDAIAAFCAAFLQAESAPGSDAGLCVLEEAAAGPALQAYGRRAKQEVLTVGEAEAMARETGAWLAGLGGDGGGVIGALAGVGLRAGGNDGRFLWLPGLRELSGTLRADELARTTGIEAVQTLKGAEAPADALVALGDWVRPVLRGGKATLFVEHTEDGWHVASRTTIKQLSD